jgi:MurNAc alpha-1-phosphate uridylyltransferase
MSAIGRTAMVLAAGHGLRMRPLTLSRPKPLIVVGGKALIEHAFERLREAGVTRAVVNAHYLAEQIEAWASRQVSPEIIISDERVELLDTGGGIVRALPWLGDDAFFVLNSDSFWIDAGEPALARLKRTWDDAEMDCLLLLSRIDQTVGYDGEGDFTIDAQGRLARRGHGGGEPFVYSGGYLVHPRLFAGESARPFSMNLLWDRAIAQGRLFGLGHRGRWLHVGTPEAIPLAEAALAEAG